MQPMIGCRRGDVVLVEFVFANEIDRKLPPALVISSDEYHRGRREVIIAAIASNVRPRLFGEQRIGDWRTAGLLFPSTVTGVIRPEDISNANRISHTQIAEARISYGGNGQITDVQQPRYGQQLLDVILPW